MKIRFRFRGTLHEDMHGHHDFSRCLNNHSQAFRPLIP
jgi:hypothetical protein